METKRGIKIFDFSIDEDKKDVISMLEKVMMTGSLVPIIGAGFTSGLRTKNGIVPSADELKSKIISIICSIDGSSEKEFSDISLADLGDTLWEEIENTTKIRYKEQFSEYIELNFTKVYDVDQARRHFLNSNWRTIFTLNYDDTIETVIDIDVAVPYEKFPNNMVKTSLIKLHGDAKKFSFTRDSRYCVLGNQQYVSLIKDPDNGDIVSALENTFFSKSVVFVGCSLDNELDLLYSAGNQLEQKAKSNGEHHIIYLLYDKGDKEIIPLIYKKYGITDIIRINQETIVDLYESIYNLSKKKKILFERDSLKAYTDIMFEYLDNRNEDNIDYLFYNEKTNVKKGIIKLPSFFIDRICGGKIERDILNEKSILHIIYGTSFSGKTYVLLQLLKNLSNKKVYYFPSGISIADDVISQLSERENAVFLIDDKVISFEQYRDILLPLLDTFEDKNIKFVLAVNKENVEFYKYYKSHKEQIKGQVSLYELKNRFEGKEVDDFNKKIGNISLIPYKANETILDFIFEVDESILKKRQKTVLPQVNFLSYEHEKTVRALIILATKGAISSKMAIDLGVDDVLYELVKKFAITVQKDYLSDLEKNCDIYSGFKFILNSTFWAVKSLSNFAKNSYNHEIIVASYENIINSYSGLENREMNKRIKSYYMLDMIQMLFANQKNKGTIRLPYLIYEKLHSSLNWNFQFLHQEAKCELRMARRESNNSKKIEMLELAYRNIGRAIKLAEDIVSGNIEYTKAHMNVTKALILINYVFTGEENQLLCAIDACYDAFILGEGVCPQLEKEELRDVRKFLDRNLKKQVTEDSLDKLNELYTRYIQKPSWNGKV